MGLTEIRNICEVSLDIPAAKQTKLHNRWHPDIPFAETIKNGETVKIECVSTPITLQIRTTNVFSRSIGLVDKLVGLLYVCWWMGVLMVTRK
jgi:acetamidase/formamidase